MDVIVDIGNSNAVVGIWNQEWTHIWRISTRTSDNSAFKLEIASGWMETGYPLSAVSQVVISSVVPRWTDIYRRTFEDFFDVPVVVLGPEIYPRLDLEMLRPTEIGADLVSNAYGALQTYQADCLIVDFGTALTFLAVSAERRIIGASIAPGIETALRALRGDTAQLPEVPIGMPEQIAGRHTVEAIQSGVIIGYEGMLLHLISKYRAWHPQPLLSVATGGLIRALPEFHKHFDVINYNLTLDGIRMIGQALK